MMPLAAIVLAAGASKRFGAGNKLLAQIGGRPLVRRVAEETLMSGVTDVVVVTGYDAPLIEEALSGLAVRIVENQSWRSGMGTSIATGARALGPDASGAFIVPGDMPSLNAGLLRTLAAAFDRRGGQSVVYPATPDGEQRNPVLWPRRYFPDLMALSGPDGAKGKLQNLADAAIAVPFADATLFADVDTRAELEAARHGR